MSPAGLERSIVCIPCLYERYCMVDELELKGRYYVHHACMKDDVWLMNKSWKVDSMHTMSV